MARLISYDYIRQKAFAEPDSGEAVVYLQDIAEAPTADAVPVVRCRECVGRPFWEEDHNGVPVCLLSGLYVRSEDDFCSYGERKEGGGNG